VKKWLKAVDTELPGKATRRGLGMAVERKGGNNSFLAKMGKVKPPFPLFIYST